MKIISRLICTFFLLLPFHRGDAKNEPAVQPVASCFIENVGQVTDLEGKAATNILYKMEQPGVTVYLTAAGLTYVFQQALEMTSPVAVESPISEAKQPEKQLFAYERFDLELAGATIKPEQITRSGETAVRYNFYIGTTGCAKTGVRAFTRLTVNNVYPGIDWLLYTNENGTNLKYDFVIHPGADPAQIRLLYRGKNKPAIENGNALAIHTGMGGLKDHIPLAYSGKPENEVDVNYRVLHSQQKQQAGCSWYETQIGFEVGRYTEALELVIDPAQLFWGTYFGTNGTCRIIALRPDHKGNIITCGQTSAMGAPVLDPGSNAYFQDTVYGSQELYFARFDSTRALQWCTYYGGNGFEDIYGMEITPDNDVLFCGYTISTTLITANPGGGAFFQPVNAGADDGLILRFSDHGILEWATYFGTALQERLYDVEVLASGAFYITGYGAAGNYPLTDPGGSFQQAQSGSFDAVLMGFSATGSLSWFTYFGDTGSETGWGVEADTSGNIYVCGTTSSVSLPAQSSPYPNVFLQPGFNGGPWDYFLVRFTPALMLDWCTYFGGNNGDFEPNIMLDHNNKLYFTGNTLSTDFPLVNPGGGAYFSQINVSNRVVACFTDSLELEWCSEMDNIHANGYAPGRIAMAIGNCNELFVGSMNNTVSSPFMATNPGNGAYFFGNTSGGLDVFIAEFDRNHVLTWGTFFGGSGTDDAVAIAIDPAGKLITGGDGGGSLYSNTTQIATFQNNCLLNPGNGAYYQALPFTLGTDYGYIAEFTLQNISPPVISTVAPTCPNFNNGSISVVAANGSSIVWQPSGATTFSISGLPAGTYMYTITDTAGCPANITGYVTLANAQLYNVNITSADLYLCAGESTTLTASGAPAVTWSPAVGTGNTITVTPATTTTYIATFTDSTGCPNVDSITVNVTPMPVAAISYPGPVCAGDTIIVSASGGISTSWLNAPNSTNPFTWLAVNDTTFTTIASNGSACPQDTVAVFIDVMNCTLTIHETLSPSFAVWPNPAATLVNMELPGNGLWNVEVYDAQGKRIVNTNLRGPKAQLPCATWSEGNYLVRISNGEKVHQFKFVKAGI
jgi:hypothetical protein